MSFPALTLYTVSGGATDSAVLGPDGNIWIADFNLGFVKMTPGGTVLASYATSGMVLQFIATDGTYLWACTTGAGSTKLARCTTSGTVTIYTVFANYGYGLCYEPTGGYLWSMDTPNVGSPYFRKISTAGSSVATYSTSGASTLAVLGPDGNIWAHGQGNNHLAKCTPGGTVTNYTPFSGSFSISGQSSGMFSDGTNLWACDETTGNGVWKIATSGVATQYAIASTQLYGGVNGQDGNNYVWGNQTGGAEYVAQLATSGSVLSSTTTMPSGFTGVLNYGGLTGVDAAHTAYVFTGSTSVLTFGIPPMSTAQLVMLV